MIIKISKAIVFVLIFCFILGCLVALSTIIDFWILDKYFEDESDYKICDVKGCKYVNINQERDCFENGIRINCSDIPIMENYYHQTYGGID